MNTTAAATIIKTHKTTGQQVAMDLRTALGYMGVYESQSQWTYEAIAARLVRGERFQTATSWFQVK